MTEDRRGLIRNARLSEDEWRHLGTLLDEPRCGRSAEDLRAAHPEFDEPSRDPGPPAR